MSLSATITAMTPHFTSYKDLNSNNMRPRATWPPATTWLPHSTVFPLLFRTRHPRNSLAKVGLCYLFVRYMMGAWEKGSFMTYTHTESQGVIRHKWNLFLNMWLLSRSLDDIDKIVDMYKHICFKLGFSEITY